MRFFKIFDQRGFSLVELMVVVAIIGILASIAIPNYQRFRRRSMQVEPKSIMSGLYTAQMVFSSEWGGLSADFAQLGFDIGSQESTRYRTGWATGSGVPNSSTDSWYHGPPAPTSTVLNINPSQCIDDNRCNNAALINAYKVGSYTFTRGSGSDCTYCNGANPKKGAI